MPEDTRIIDRLIALAEPMAETDVALHPDTNLVDELCLDSTKVMNLLLELEDEFDVAIPLNALADVHTVGDLAELIRRYRGAG